MAVTVEPRGCLNHVNYITSRRKLNAEDVHATNSIVHLRYLLCYYNFRVLGYRFIFSISYLPCSCSLKTTIKNFVINYFPALFQEQTNP